MCERCGTEFLGSAGASLDRFCSEKCKRTLSTAVPAPPVDAPAAEAPLQDPDNPFTSKCVLVPFLTPYLVPASCLRSSNPISPNSPTPHHSPFLCAVLLDIKLNYACTLSRVERVATGPAAPLHTARLNCSERARP